MKICAVVLNYKREQDTVACVRSIRATAPEVDVVVVDNASTSASAAAIEDECPGATLIRNEQNLGYAGGNNRGIAHALDAGAEAVLVLNNDLTVEPGCVQALRAALRERAEWGIVGPLSLLAGPGDVVDFFAARVILAQAALEVPGRDEPRAGRFTAPEETGYVTGSAMLVRREVFERAGVFDERFFLMWEDVDLSVRAGKAGWTLGVTPDAIVRHARSASFGGEASALNRYFFVRNPYLVLRKHVLPPARWLAEYRATRRYRSWARDAADPAVRRAITLGMRHGLRGRFGPPPSELL